MSVAGQRAASPSVSRSSVGYHIGMPNRPLRSVSSAPPRRRSSATTTVASPRATSAANGRTAPASSPSRNDHTPSAGSAANACAVKFRIAAQSAMSLRPGSIAAPASDGPASRASKPRGATAPPGTSTMRTSTPSSARSASIAWRCQAGTCAAVTATATFTRRWSGVPEAGRARGCEPPVRRAALLRARRCAAARSSPERSTRTCTMPGR